MYSYFLTFSVFSFWCNSSCCLCRVWVLCFSSGFASLCGETLILMILQRLPPSFALSWTAIISHITMSTKGLVLMIRKHGFQMDALINLLVTSAFFLCSTSSTTFKKELQLCFSSSSECSLNTCCETDWLPREKHTDRKWVTKLLATWCFLAVFRYYPPAYPQLGQSVFFLNKQTNRHTHTQNEINN